MTQHIYIPGPPLSALVKQLWLYEGYAPAHSKERILPGGTVELIFNLREDYFRIYDQAQPDQYHSFREGGGLLVGAYSGFFVIDTAQQAATMGVHFKPGGAFPFFKLPADELCNSHVSLEQLWGAEAVHLREKLLTAGTPPAKFSILEQFLVAQAARPLRQHPAIAFALQAFQAEGGAETVGEMAAQTGFSSRRFSQLFSQQVGLTPKLFGRICRFQQVLSLLYAGPASPDWSVIALNCGYFDQAHFIHDFQAFAGLTPTHYLAKRIEHLNHVPL